MSEYLETCKKTILDYAVAEKRLTSKYPQCWRELDGFLNTPELSWPDWCLYPLAAAIAVTSRGGRVELSIGADAQDLACLASWRVTRGVYRFDDWLYSELVKTDIKTDLPMSVFFNLPQHCIYIELRGALPYCGVFVWLEYDVNTQEAELRLAFDDGRSLLHVPLSLVFEQSLEDAVKYALRDAAQNAEKHGIKIADTQALMPDFDAMAHVVNLLLFICSDSITDIAAADGGYPRRAVKSKTKQGWRYFPADKETLFFVGNKIAASLRAAAQRSGVAPHVRRAHWHGYWVGQGRTQFVYRWIAPVIVS